MAAKHNRAVQFTPFAALRGFETLLQEKETVKADRRILLEDSAAILSEKIRSIRKGMMISVVHYKNGAYLTTTGLVSSIDTTYRTLTVVKCRILFDDIYTVWGDSLIKDADVF